MVRVQSNLLNVVVVAALGTLLSACVTTSGSGAQSSATTPNYVVSSAGGLEVEPLDFDPEDAPKACVNDLRVYRAHLQMPAVSRVDLNKPVNNYLQEAGGADAAITQVNSEINQLNQQLDLELARRNPFNEASRRRSDDAIATIEDNILLNEALAEALACRR